MFLAKFGTIVGAKISSRDDGRTQTPVVDKGHFTQITALPYFPCYDRKI